MLVVFRRKRNRHLSIAAASNAASRDPNHFYTKIYEYEYEDKVFIPYTTTGIQQ